MNNALCGDPKALPGGDIGHSAYPDAVWSARVRVRPTPTTYVQAGVYEVNQGLYSYANFRSGFKFDTSQDSGVYVPVEAGYEPLVGAGKMPGHYKIGFGYDSPSNFKDFATALNATANTSAGATVSTRTGNTQVWVLVDQMVVRQGPGDTSGIILLSGFVHNAPTTRPTRSSISRPRWTKASGRRGRRTRRACCSATTPSAVRWAGCKRDKRSWASPSATAPPGSSATRWSWKRTTTSTWPRV